MPLLFVYGSLKRGFPLHEALVRSQFLGEAKIAGYALYDLGWYPGAYSCQEPQALLWGEVYRVDEATLAEIDRVEGVDLGEYRRVQDDAQLPERGAMRVWLYECCLPLPKPVKRVPEGRWLKKGA